ncbi:MAG: GGDEF domain-containing protein [Candidatus Zixiibacteriota bacterium]
MTKNNNSDFKILLIDNNAEEIGRIKELITGSTIGLIDVPCLNSALARIRESGFDAALMDIDLQDENGIDAIARIHSLEPALPVIILADTVDERYALHALKMGAQDYLLRDVLNTNMLKRVIRYAIERHRLVSRLRSLSLVDQLTGLNNLRGFMTLSRQQLRNSERSATNFQLWFFDIDDMKWINDTLGHAAGDSALIQTAKILENSFRKSDILARIGGDEFTVLAIDCAGQKAVKAISERIERFIVETNKNQYFGFKLSISYGVAEYRPNVAISIDELLARADRKMYSHKRRKLKKTA